jgi:hypothetical protein
MRDFELPPFLHSMGEALISPFPMVALKCPESNLTGDGEDLDLLILDADFYLFILE